MRSFIFICLLLVSSSAWAGCNSIFGGMLCSGGGSIFGTPVCVKTGEVCTDSSTRIIGGTAFSRCWNYQSTYSCRSESFTDHCTAVAATPGCTQINSTCTKTNSTGACDTYENTYTCGSRLTNLDNITYLDSSYTITSDILDKSACLEPENNQDCNLTSQVCVEGAATRNINGLDVYKDCWKYDYTYSCIGDVQYNDCDALAENCTYQSTKCLAKNDEGACLSGERSYQCDKSAPDTSQMVCQGQVYCINGDCGQAEQTPDTGLAKGLSYMNLLKKAGEEFREDKLSIFSGQSNYCDKAIAGFNNCCSDDGWGQNLNIASCSPNEKALAIKAGAGQCHYVGTYCEQTTFFGVCRSKRKTYCCFNSKLARILHEQSRGQLGISWGSAQSPQCAGLTIDQLQSVDFEGVDMSELYPDAMDGVSVPDDSGIVEDLSNKIEGYYAQ